MIPISSPRRTPHSVSNLAEGYFDRFKSSLRFLPRPIWLSRFTPKKDQGEDLEARVRYLSRAGQLALCSITLSKSHAIPASHLCIRDRCFVLLVNPKAHQRYLLCRSMAEHHLILHPILQAPSAAMPNPVRDRNALRLPLRLTLIASYRRHGYHSVKNSSTRQPSKNARFANA